MTGVMAANWQKAVLVGGFEPFPWRTGIPVDVFNMRTALFDVYGLGSDDVSVLVNPPFTGPNGVGTAINVWTTVLEAYQQLEIGGGNVLLYIACHGNRYPTNPLKNNSCYVEELQLAEGEFSIDYELKLLSEMRPLGVELTIAVNSCHSGGILEAAPERMGSSTWIPPPHSAALQQLEMRRVVYDWAGPCLTTCESFEVARCNIFHYGGAFTYSMIRFLYHHHRVISSQDIVREARHLFSQYIAGYNWRTRQYCTLLDFQSPCLYGSRVDPLF